MKLMPLILMGGLGYLLYETAYGAPVDGDVAPTGQGFADDPDGASNFSAPSYTSSLDSQELYMDPNVAAFLLTIRESEDGYMTPDANRYQMFYGGSLFTNMADHPCITGEKARIQLPDHFCAGAGLNPPCYSSAAGAYQINVPTWNSFRVDMGDGYGYLADFTPKNQDLAALRIARGTGALDSLEAGSFTTAVAQASKRWASLAGSTSGQAQHDIGTLLSWFQGAGGLLTS